MKNKIRKALLAAVILGITLEWFFAIASHAQDMTAERAACEADARKLCSAGDLFVAFLGNPRPVAHCLITNKTRISPACRDMLRAHHATD